MADRISQEQRSALMRSVKQRNTKPEMIVRRLLHARGWRYRLNRKSLPGSPDIVFPSRRKAIFVHGCFWHGHSCKKGKLPSSNLEYWSAKIDQNRKRDTRVETELLEEGWRSFVVWQCDLDNRDAILLEIEEFLNRGE
jgi:DNA mismatch endonuclease (patch repair protein)